LISSRYATTCAYSSGLRLPGASCGMLWLMYVNNSETGVPSHDFRNCTPVWEAVV